MDWDKLRIFHAVAEAGSFTHAGEKLNLSQSAVSRQISHLEDEVGVDLFHRHARGLALTEQGEVLFRTVHEMSAKLAMTEALLSDVKEKPSGELKITTTVGFGSTWLTPRLKEFLEHYPDISVHLVVDDRELDLAMREADVAIRMREPVQSDLVRRKLVTVNYHVFAAPEYLARHGTPQNIADLADHNLIIYGDQAPSVIQDVNWLLRVDATKKDRRHALLKVNNIYGVLRAAESGLGIAALPDYMISPTSTALVQILPDLAGPTFNTYFVYPEELRKSKRIAVFRDFLIQKVAEGHF
jgi:DNA-binding transcriptional LysR family regulator